MVTITVHEDCDNAPKKRFLRDFIVAVVSNDSAFVARNVTDDIYRQFRKSMRPVSVIYSSGQWRPLALKCRNE